MIAVTGANGFVGNALVHSLANSFEPHEVLALSRKPLPYLPRNVKEIIFRDLSLFPQGHQIFRNVSTVVHCAALVHVTRHRYSASVDVYRQVNVLGTINLARKAAQAGVRRFVFLSSVKVNGESTIIGNPFTPFDIPAPSEPYGISKLEAEQSLTALAAETGMEVVIVRPPLVYGPGAKANFAALLRAVQRGWPLPFGCVHNQRSFLALENLVDFISTCATHPAAANHTFLVSDGQDLSTIELVRGIAKATGVSARLLPVPVWALRAGGVLLGKGNMVQRLCCNLQVDISNARNLLGWVPPVSVEDGLRRAIVL